MTRLTKEQMDALVAFIKACAAEAEQFAKYGKHDDSIVEVEEMALRDVLQEAE